MKTKLNVLVLFILLGGLILSACGASAAATEPSYDYASAATEAFAMEAPAAPEQGAVEADSAAKGDSSPYVGGSPQDAAYAASHMIIKNADIKLLVENTDDAMGRMTQAVGDVGGYIISSRVWYQPWSDGENYKYATITIGVPVDQFERTLNRLRGIAVRVLDESATGEDVTDQYVDLQSQLTNLQATRERIKSFLDQATTVDEALRINQELSNVEAQIEEIQGRMNYLQDRAAYSTITINFEPVLPDLRPTPTPTPNPWKPAETFKDATKAVTSAYQGIVDFLIWFVVVLIPIFAPPVLIVWAIWKLLTRKPKTPAQ
jgi:hypothetical protein